MAHIRVRLLFNTCQRNVKTKKEEEKEEEKSSILKGLPVQCRLRSVPMRTYTFWPVLTSAPTNHLVRLVTRNAAIMEIRKCC